MGEKLSKSEKPLGFELEEDCEEETDEMLDCARLNEEALVLDVTEFCELSLLRAFEDVLLDVCTPRPMEIIEDVS